MKERVAELRKQLKKHKVTAFIIPSNDEFMGEYIPPSAQRLKWLTGFDGSYGLAIVHTKQLAFFTDGRYTVQAKKQVPSFTLVDIQKKRPAQWAEEKLTKKDVLGYDPWLITQNGLEHFERAAANAGFKLKAVPNLVDAIWKDKPAHPDAPAEVHSERFAGKSSAQKRKEIAKALKEKDVHAALLTAADSICWLLNIRGKDVPRTPFVLSYAVFYASGKVTLFVPKGKIPPAVKKHLGAAVTLKALDKKLLAAELNKLKGKKVLADAANTPSWFFSALAGTKVVRGEDPCQLPKACKNAVEIAGARKAHERDGLAVIKALYWIESEARKGELTELDVVRMFEMCRSESDKLRDLSFDTIAGFGPNGAIVHYRVKPETNRTIKTGNLLLIDSGGQYPDGTTDITRTVSIGTPKPEHKSHFTRVLKGHIRLARARFPEGTTGAQLDVLARFPLWQAGLDYSHGTGHGVGSYLSVHEGPQRISRDGDAPLREGMIISNEPGYYKEGAYGIRIESLVAVKESRMRAEGKFFEFETLTLVPFDKRLIEKKALTQAEIRWINAYHRRVYETLAARLEKPQRQWLKKATAAL